MKITNQHGDLLFGEVKAIPDGAIKQSIHKGYVLERGEGVHLHTLEDVEGIEVYEHEGKTYIHTTMPVKINHEEHGIQVIEPGIKEKLIEREWDYEADEARKTLD